MQQLGERLPAIWIENPYTGQRLNIEPLLRFEARQYVEDYPRSTPIGVTDRTKLIVSNAVAYLRDFQEFINPTTDADFLQEVKQTTNDLTHVKLLLDGFNTAHNSDIDQ